MIFVPTFSLVFFHCQHSIVWEDLKPLKLKEESNPVLSSLGQKLLHSRDENIFGLHHLHKPCVKFFRPNSRETPGQQYQFSEVLSKMPKDSKEKHSLNIPILILALSIRTWGSCQSVPNYPCRESDWLDVLWIRCLILNFKARHWI